MGFNMDIFEGALSAADTAAIGSFLQRGADPIFPLSHGWTALHHIAFIEEVNPQGRYGEAVALIVHAGGDVNASEKTEGCTPLHFAAGYSRSTSAGLAVVQALLEAGANPNRQDARGRTPLHRCVNWCHSDETPDYDDKVTDIIEVLLANGADIQCRDMSGRTALHLASRCGHRDAVDLLLASGAEANCTNRDGQGALHGAIRGGHSRIVRRLLTAGADPNLMDHQGNSPLHYAAQAEGIEEWGVPPITYERIIGALTDDGADPLVRNLAGCLPSEAAVIPVLQRRLAMEEDGSRSRA